MLVGTAVRSVQLSTGPNFTLNFSDDFTYSDNTVPTGWTDKNSSTNTALTHSYVVTNRLDHLADVSSSARYTTIYRSAPAADLDIVFTAGATAGTVAKYIGVRASTHSTTSGTTFGYWSNGYFLQMTDGTTALLVKRVSHTQTTLATLTMPVSSTTAMTSNPMRFRLRAYGSSIKLRMWRSDSTEPTTWDAEVTDSDVTSTGSIALGITSGNSTQGINRLRVDNFECYA